MNVLTYEITADDYLSNSEALLKSMGENIKAGFVDLEAIIKINRSVREKIAHARSLMSDTKPTADPADEAGAKAVLAEIDRLLADNFDRQERRRILDRNGNVLHVDLQRGMSDGR